MNATGKTILALLSLGLLGAAAARASSRQPGRAQPSAMLDATKLRSLLGRVPESERAAFHSKIIDVSSRLGIDPDWLIGLMYFESRLNPAAKNPNSSATGLIQFMDATARDLGTSTAALAAMSRVQQMQYVEQYLARQIRAVGRPDNIGEVYLLIFYPKAVKMPDGYVLGSDVSDTRARAIARANPQFDLDKDGYISKREVSSWIESYFLNL